ARTRFRARDPETRSTRCRDSRRYKACAPAPGPPTREAASRRESRPRWAVRSKKPTPFRSCPAQTGEATIEEDVTAEGEPAPGRAGGLVDSIDLGQLETGPSAAEQHQGDGNLQPIERAGRDETRHGEAAALEKNAAEPAPPKLGDDGGGRQMIAFGVDLH